MAEACPRGWYSRGYLPHFDGGAVTQSVTFRLAGSLPEALLSRWRAEVADEEDDLTSGSREDRAPTVRGRLDPHARRVHDGPRQLPARGMPQDLNGHHHAAILVVRDVAVEHEAPGEVGRAHADDHDAWPDASGV